MHLAINGTDLGRQRGGNESFLMGLLQGINQASLPVTTTVLAAPAGLHTLPGLVWAASPISAYTVECRLSLAAEPLLRGIKPVGISPPTSFRPAALQWGVIDTMFRSALIRVLPLPMYMRALTRQAIGAPRGGGRFTVQRERPSGIILKVRLKRLSPIQAWITLS